MYNNSRNPISNVFLDNDMSRSYIIYPSCKNLKRQSSHPKLLHSLYIYSSVFDGIIFGPHAPLFTPGIHAGARKLSVACITPARSLGPRVTRYAPLCTKGTSANYILISSREYACVRRVYKRSADFRPAREIPLCFVCALFARVLGWS